MAIPKGLVSRVSRYERLHAIHDSEETETVKTWFDTTLAEKLPEEMKQRFRLGQVSEHGI